jgi:alanyl-tRNA synthetase
MITEKLYYKDAYIRDFDSRVTSVDEKDDFYYVVLESTAFFPEEGGQSADGGYINGVEVLDVCEKNGIVYHKTKEKLEVGETVSCRLNFEERFSKMQLHTAEHILCGIIHKKFGYENVGFHIDKNGVTFDIGGILTKEDLESIELEANKVVFSNEEVTTFFPTEEELSTLDYRSKLDLSEKVRLVKIGEYDLCACCAPHVSWTGEVGMIKILDFMKHRGGTRIFMQAGLGAYTDYKIKSENVKRISGILSTPAYEVAEALEKYTVDTEDLKRKLKLLSSRLVKIEAERVKQTEQNAVCFLEDATADDLRLFVNIAKQRVKGYTVAVSGVDGDYKYVIGANGVDLGKCAQTINAVLSGRGGGRGEMIQGSFHATLSDIESFFEDFK